MAARGAHASAEEAPWDEAAAVSALGVHYSAGALVRLYETRVARDPLAADDGAEADKRLRGPSDTTL